MNKIIYLVMFILLSSLVSGAISDKLIAYYKFENSCSDSATAYDGKQENCIERGVTGTATYSSTTYKLGSYSVYFNTTKGHYLNYTKSDEYYFKNPKNMSVNVWVKYRAFGSSTFQGIYSIYGKQTADYSGVQAHTYNNGGKLQMQYFKALSASTMGSSWGSDITTISTTKWYMMTTVWDTQKGVIVYLNGTVIHNATGTVGNIYYNVVYNPITIGASFNGVTKSYYMDGFLDEMSIFNRSLTKSEVATLYNSGSGYEIPVSSSIKLNASINFSSLTPANNSNLNKTVLYQYKTNNFNKTANCNISVNNVVRVTQNNITNGTHYFNVTTAYGIEGNNNITVLCRAFYNKSMVFTQHKNYFQDTVNPVIDFIRYNASGSKNLANIYVNSSKLEFNFGYTDTNAYLFNVSINRSTITKKTIQALNIPKSSYTQYITNNFTSLTQGKYEMTLKVCDGHTTKNLNPSDPSLFFGTDRVGAFDVLLIPVEPLQTYPSLVFSGDRFKPLFNYITTSNTHKYILKSKYKLDKVKDTSYRGHFISLGGSYSWIDFDNEFVTTDNYKKISDYEYNITLTFSKNMKTVNFNSIGLINCVSSKILFYISLPPTLTAYSKTPNDINESNGFPYVKNIWNYTNAVTFSPYVKLNFSSYFINKVSYRNSIIYHSDYTNTSKSVTHYTYDNELYGGSHNVNPEIFRNTTHSNLQTNSVSNYVKVTINNVSSTTIYNYYEFMVNSSVPNVLYSTIICNSSYTSGNPTTSSNCAIIANTNTSSKFNHCHYYSLGFNNSCHMKIPFTIVSGKVNGIKVTPTMYFIQRGISGLLNHYYINVASFTGNSQVSYNNGNTWGDIGVSATLDQHIHQLSMLSSATIGIRGCNLYGLCVSINETDTLQFSPRQPSTVSFYSPKNQSYNTTEPLLISYTASNGTYAIQYYNVFVMNGSTNTNVKTIVNHSSNLLSHNTFLGVGSYHVDVEAHDTNGFSSWSHSDIFSMVVPPTTTTTTLINIVIPTTTTTFYMGEDRNNAFSDSNDSIYTLFLFFGWVIFIYMFIKLRGFHGRPIQLFNLAQLGFGVILFLTLLDNNIAISSVIVMVSTVMFFFGVSSLK